MKTFEYLTEYFKDLNDDYLNNYGDEGWELVVVIPGTYLNTCVFKREKMKNQSKESKV